ncbi:MAG: hypothetical protein FAF05_05495 [Epsilonproteobacteria bacterium]|nr:hypothetical protein [Campylobacterota bacterium]
MKVLLKILLGFVFLSPTVISAVDLAFDQFSNYSADGYSRDDGWKNQLKVKDKKDSKKTYNFGTSYANATLNVTFKMKWRGGWEDSGYYQDYFKAYFNGTEKINDTFKGAASNWKSYSLTVTADGSGKLEIKFYANTTNAGEYIMIDDVKISSQQTTLPPPQFVYENKLLPFSLVNPKETQNIIGNTQIIGNTVECVTPYYYYSGYSYSVPTSSNALRSAHCDNNLDHNDNNHFIKYIDIDNDANTFNSSSATIKIPGTYKKIAWAGLFWQGHINDTSYLYYSNGWTMSTDFTQHVANNFANGTSNTVKLNIANKGYTTVTAEKYNYLYRADDIIYSAFANITKQLKDANITSDTTITVADIISTQGLETSLGNYGAWTLVIIYKEDKNNPASRLRNNSVYLGYQQVYSNSAPTITIDGFLLPKRETIDSQVAVFAAEGEYAYSPDSIKLDGVTLGTNTCTKNIDDPSCKTNMFDAKLSPSMQRTPRLTNNNGIDIDVFDSSSIMTAKRDANPNATTYSSSIKLSSGGDLYLPSMLSFTTELYKPRVCYYIDTIKDSSGQTIFENGSFVTGAKLTPNTNYTFNFWISNMKKNSTNIDIEIANKVQVYLNMTNFNYKSSSTNMQNIGASNFVSISDQYNADSNYSKPADDLGEYNNKTSTWRVGSGAGNTHGGTLDVANGFLDTANIVKVNLQGSLTTAADATSINLLDYLEFKASFQTDTITIAPDNAQLIAQCQDLNTTGGVASIAGAFNVVNANFPAAQTTDPILTASSSASDKALNAIPTQISNKPMLLKLLALAADNVTLQPYTGDVNISIIPTPNYVTGDTSGNQIKCENATPLNTPQTFTFNGTDRLEITLTNISYAISNASFKIEYDGGITCSRDVFAIRPDRFLLTPPNTDIELLHAGVYYGFSLTAAQYGNTLATPDYTLTNAQDIFTDLDANKTVYAPDGTVPNPPLSGTLSFSTTPFDIVNGFADQSVAMSFNNVGKVNIKLIDKDWAQVDINNADTPTDCSSNGAYICGDINATFIPDHFTLTGAHLYNNNGATFTYFSNDLNISASLSLSVTAKTSGNATTANFHNSAWENPVDVNFTVPSIGSLSSNINAINNTQKLGFNSGVKNISFSETNRSANLIFNYSRTKNTPINPVKIDGTNITLNASSLYTASSGVTDTITGAVTADQNATFVYGRAHSSKQRYEDPNTAPVAHNTNIYYEIYCYGGGCDTSLLPSNKHLDDIRWYQNTNHNTATDGTITNISQTNALGKVSTHNLNTANNPSSVQLSYDGTLGYPYTTTMQISASNWLIYNENNPSATTNPFQVEFNKATTGWVGKHATNATTQTDGNIKTNRRTIW